MKIVHFKLKTSQLNAVKGGNNNQNPTQESAPTVHLSFADTLVNVLR